MPMPDAAASAASADKEKLLYMANRAISIRPGQPRPK